MDIAKAGWLHRKSTILHRWKRNWFVLYRTGDLWYFDSPGSNEAEEHIVVRALVTHIRTGQQCDFAPPDGQSTECLLVLECREDNPSLKLCAESPDDMKAWQIALEEARAMNQPAVGCVPPVTQYVTPVYNYSTSPFSSGYYPGQVICTRPQQPISVGNTGVVYVGDPDYQYRRRHFGGPMLYGPMIWW